MTDKDWLALLDRYFERLLAEHPATIIARLSGPDCRMWADWHTLSVGEDRETGARIPDEWYDNE
jgi:hypothetical protein